MLGRREHRRPSKIANPPQPSKPPRHPALLLEHVLDVAMLTRGRQQLFVLHTGRRAYSRELDCRRGTAPVVLYCSFLGSVLFDRALFENSARCDHFS